jgi:uncharacterized SAM-dependent methyltransferase
VDDAQVALTMNEGDSIWTESSYKYRPSQIVAMLERNGFALRKQWVDATAQFALTLVEAK